MAALAGCKGGGALDYSNPNTPPAPIQIADLLAGFVTGFTLADEAEVADLLANDQRYTVQNTPWNFLDNQGNPVGPTYNSYSLRSSGAAYAHAVGLTGLGQVIAFVDDGFNHFHEALAGRVTMVPGSTYGRSEHGTHVATVAAGNSPSVIGVAPGAEMISFSYNDLIYLGSAEAPGYNAVALNNSWEFEGLDVSQDSFDTLFVGDPVMETYLSSLDTYAAQGNVVFALSNDDTATHAGIMNALPFLRPSLEAGWIAVGNAVPTMNGQTVASVQMISADCMEAARWCILADGATTGGTAYDPITGLPSNNSYSFGTGTSFAAPQVSGALALLAEAFPTLSFHDLRVRLLASAQDDFFTPDATIELATGYDKGYSYTYGHGFLDIKAALLPIGPTAMALADGGVHRAGTPLVVAGAGMGDAISRSLDGIDVTVTDALSAGFRMPATTLASSSGPSSIASGLAARAARTDLSRTREAAPDAFASLAAFGPAAPLSVSGEGGAAISLSLPGGLAGQEGGVSLRQRLIDGPVQVDLGLRLARDGSVVGFGAGTSRLLSVELGVTQALGTDAFLMLAGETGIADLSAPSALSAAGGARFDGASLAVGRRNAFTEGDRLTLGVGLPIAVTAGNASVALPVALAAGGTEMRSVPLGLAPEERQVDLMLSYQMPVGDNAEMVFEVQHSENFGNRAGLRDTGAVIAWQVRF
jgi:hypothetical protein